MQGTFRLILHLLFGNSFILYFNVLEVPAMDIIELTREIGREL